MFTLVQKLHRLAGLVAVLLILFLTVTGVLLNHTEELSLYDSYTENSLVLWLFGFDEEGAREEFIEEPPTWERVLTGFHAGRFFGGEGAFFLDLAAVVLIFLALSGPYLWIKRHVLLRTNRKALEEEDLLEKTEKLLKVKESARSFLDRAGQLHDLSEHVLEHIKGAPEGPVARDVVEIEGHLKELDARMHRLISRIKKLEEDVATE